MFNVRMLLTHLVVTVEGGPKIFWQLCLIAHIFKTPDGPGPIYMGFGITVYIIFALSVHF